MNNFDKASHNSWLANSHTQDVVKRLEIIRFNLLDQAALLADKTEIDTKTFLIRANAVKSVIKLLKEGDLDNITEKLI